MFNGNAELGRHAHPVFSFKRPGHIHREMKGAHSMGSAEDGSGPAEPAWCRGTPLQLDLWHFISFFNLAAATEIQTSQRRALSFNLFSLLNVQPNFCLLCSILGIVGRDKENVCFAFSSAISYQSSCKWWAVSNFSLFLDQQLMEAVSYPETYFFN